MDRRSRDGQGGLVLAGGGARAAYQVGVLQAMKEIIPDPRSIRSRSSAAPRRAP
jgi:predicted acylesterase/phospholipase RssA